MPAVPMRGSTAPGGDPSITATADGARLFVTHPEGGPVALAL